MFWQAVEALHEWERCNLPGVSTPQGNEVFVWLLKSQAESRPLKDLYHSSRYSEPTTRACLKHFVDKGFVLIEAGGHDGRTRLARWTPKFEEIVNEYSKRFEALAQLAERSGLPQ